MMRCSMTAVFAQGATRSDARGDATADLEELAGCLGVRHALEVDGAVVQPDRLTAPMARVPLQHQGTRRITGKGPPLPSEAWDSTCRNQRGSRIISHSSSVVRSRCR